MTVKEVFIKIWNFIKPKRCLHPVVEEGGGMYDDLWTCCSCGLEKYPEAMPYLPSRKVVKKNATKEKS